MPEPAFQQGEALQWVTIENGFNSKRMVTFQEARSEHAAVVSFGLERLTVAISELSRVAPPQPPPWLPGWFSAPKVPPKPSSESIDAKLSERRQALSQALDRAKLAQETVTAARSISQRAQREVTEARATLATLDRHDRQQQRQLEDALAAGKPVPARSNGHDRGYIVQRVAAAEQAQARFDGELAAAMASLGDALSAVRKAAATVVAAIVEREAENLRAMEERAALLRAELTSVAGWWPSAEIGLLKVGRATAVCIEAPLAWQDQPAVRTGGGWIKPWQGVFDRLVQGDVEADHELEKD